MWARWAPNAEDMRRRKYDVPLFSTVAPSHGGSECGFHRVSCASRVEANLRYRGPFYRLTKVITCWGIGGSSHSDCLTYCGRSAPSHCSHCASLLQSCTAVNHSERQSFPPSRNREVRRSGPVSHPRPGHVVAHAVGSCHGWLPRRIFGLAFLLLP